MAADPAFLELMDHLRDSDPQAARVVFDQYVHRLICLAGARLPGVLAPKLDPEDVVQSVFRSFFTRQAAHEFELGDWDSLWTLLALLTVRKCRHRLRHFLAARRDVRRESPPGGERLGRGREVAAVAEPTASEAAALTETLEQMLRSLNAVQRIIVQLRLQGYTNEEISSRAGCTERTVYRVLVKVRTRLAGLLTNPNAA